MNWRRWVGIVIFVLFLVLPRTSFAAPEVDTDGDGLSDRLEGIFGSDLNVVDTDGDGYSDGVEIASAHSPTSTSSELLRKSIRITLSTQKLVQEVAGIAISEYIVSSGKPGMPTPVGSFTIKNKNKRAWSSSAKLWMPYWMAFDFRGHGIHELPEWPGGKKEGKDHLGKPVSHGCVRVDQGIAKLLFDWTPVGTSVVIQK